MSQKKATNKRKRTKFEGLSKQKKQGEHGMKGSIAGQLEDRLVKPQHKLLKT